MPWRFLSPRPSAISPRVGGNPSLSMKRRIKANTSNCLRVRSGMAVGGGALARAVPDKRLVSSLGSFPRHHKHHRTTRDAFAKAECQQKKRDRVGGRERQ